MTQFMRKAEIIIGDRIFSIDDFDFSFDVPFDDDTEPNEAKFDIYNLSDNTKNNIKKGAKVVINAGYRDSYGTILIGTVSKKEISDDKINELTTVHVMDSTDKWAGKEVNKTYKGNIKANQIISDLAASINLALVIDLPKNTAYPRGFTANGSFMDVVKQVAKDCGASAFINKGKLFVRSAKVGDNARYILNSDTGLIGTPEYFEEEDRKGYKVKCLLNHRITTASIIQLDSIKVKGAFRVQKGRHTYSGNTYYTEMEVIAV